MFDPLQPHGPLQAPLPMGILQARIVEWVAMPFSRGGSLPLAQTGKTHRFIVSVKYQIPSTNLGT